jgi:phage recombination protein Bet
VTGTIATRQAALAVADDQTEFTQAQLEAFGLEKATRGEQLVFLHTVQRTGLDPAARQIYSIGRWDARDQREKYGIQTGIDGYRLIARRAADRSGESIAYGASEWCGPDGVWRDVWLSSEPPAAARAMVLRNGMPFSAVAVYSEYVQTRQGNQPNRMWATMPSNQLLKCAEALALRKAFPQELAGIYTDEEMGGGSDSRPVAARSVFAAPAQGEPVNITVNGEPVTVTVVDVERPGSAHPEADQPIDTKSNLMKALHATLRESFDSREEGYAYVAAIVGREIGSTSELTNREASAVIDAIRADPAGPEGTP